MGNKRGLSRVVARQAALENAIAALRRRYGDRIIRMAADAPALVGASGSGALSTGSLSLDLLTGGLPRGQISEIAGLDGTGKGTLAYAALAACQCAGGLALLVDADNAADPDALRAAGVDLTCLLLAYPAGANAAWDVLGALARCGALDLLTLTSLNGLLILPGAGWASGSLERRLTRLATALRGRRTALLMTNLPLPLPEGTDAATLATAAPRATVGGAAVARVAALRIALAPSGVRFTPYGDVASLCSTATAVRRHASPCAGAVALEIAPGGPRRAAELIALAEACGCVAHTPLGLLAGGAVLGRTADRAAATLEADPMLAATLEAAVRAVWERRLPSAPPAGLERAG